MKYCFYLWQICNLHVKGENRFAFLIYRMGTYLIPVIGLSFHITKKHDQIALFVL